MIEKAHAFAAEAHKGQFRKSDNKPMITHPIRVAEILKQAGFSKTVIAAGLLHDTVEDTWVTIEDIAEAFGDEVATLVAGNTENKSHSWETRKQHTVDWIAEAPLEVKALIVADKLDNLKSMIESYGIMGDELWDQFKRGRDKQKWYFENVSKNAFKNLDPKEIPPFFREYRELVEAFF